jgi:hypothetical protein
MKSIFKKMITVSALLFFTLAVAACSDEGTAEKAGKEVDKAFDSVKEKIHDATK